jgi:hypothetical protein
VTARCSLTIPAALQAQVLEHLFSGDRDEHGLIIVAGVARDRDQLRLLAREVFPAVDGFDYVAGRHGYRMLRAEFIQPIIRHCRQQRLAYIAVHNHGGIDTVAFSQDDFDSHERGYPALLDLTEGMPVGAAVYAPHAIAGDIWLEDGTRHPLAETRVLGANIERLYDSPRRLKIPAAGTPLHDRQLLMFGPEGQELLRSATVGVIGAGGVGSLLVEFLARLGVGKMVVADDDRIALSNLSRVVGATRWDARYPFSMDRMPTSVRTWARRHATHKITVARRAARRANPNVALEGIIGDFARDDVAHRFLSCDYLFLAADSMRARLVFNAIVQQYFIPGIQIGTKIVPGQDESSVEDAFSVERWVLPRISCLWCSGMISPHLLALEAKTDEERKDQRYGTSAANPSVITMNAVGASHATNDFLMSYLGLHSTDVNPSPRRFKHLARRVIEETYPPDPTCTECGAGEASRFGRGDGTQLPTIQRFVPGRREMSSRSGSRP